MWKRLVEFREQYKMFSADDKVIAGISGGADSMCLLCVLETWKHEIGFDLIVVHVNHQLRGNEADQDEAYVRQVCEERKIPFVSYHVNIRQLAKERHLTEEEAGRIARREAFDDAMKKQQGTKIALAHHKNDNVETFFFNLVRGSRLKGLSGMQPVNGVYVRPLLILQRQEIEDFLQKEQMTYCIDATNETDLYARNRIRRHVVPYLETQVNEKTVEHIDQTMKYFHEVQEYLEGQMGILWETLTEPCENGILIKQAIENHPKLMRKMVFRKALTEVSGKNKDILEVHVDAIEELVGKQTGKSRDLPYQMCAKKVYQGIEIGNQERMQKQLPEMEIDLKKSSMEYSGHQIEIRVFDRTEETVQLPKKRFTKWFDYDIITESVCIRGKRPGDRITISENGNSQKLKQFFINEKIPSSLREQIPVLAEGNKILWVIGYRQSKAYQVTEQTRQILEIKINGGNEDGRQNQSDDSRGRSCGENRRDGAPD